MKPEVGQTWLVRCFGMLGTVAEVTDEHVLVKLPNHSIEPMVIPMAEFLEHWERKP